MGDLPSQIEPLRAQIEPLRARSPTSRCRSPGGVSRSAARERRPRNARAGWAIKDHARRNAAPAAGVLDLTLRPVGRLWRDGDFLRFWAASAISDLGSQVSALALPLIAALTLGATPW